MRWLLFARDGSESDDDWTGKRRLPDDEGSKDARGPASTRRLLLRCYACRGTGRLVVQDATCPKGREARCVACHGSGRVSLG